MKKSGYNFIIIGFLLFFLIGEVKSQDSLNIEFVDLHFVMTNNILEKDKNDCKIIIKGPIAFYRIVE
ncbi:MAG: hypothetical protein GXO79_10520 [Chlorobi bacterium]|nr:hypothetical protein [Chlorobiota bacterium]